MATFCDYCSRHIMDGDKIPNKRRRFCNVNCRVRYHRNHERVENLSRVLESLMIAGVLLPERRGDYERAAILAQNRMKRIKGI